MNYKDLKIWILAREISVEIHRMTFALPKFEMYETGSQIRRSSKSTRANIVEGYGRRKYKNDLIRFIIIALSSNDETLDHLEVLYETRSLKCEQTFNHLHNKILDLGKMLNGFLKTIEKSHNT